MTITYTAEVATSSLGCFLKLLLRWRGSMYKLLWKDFLLFLAAYYGLNLMYRFALTEDQRIIFEKVSLYCDSFNNLIPVAFVLGFYVSIVVTRWWDQFNTIPWPDTAALYVTALIHGHDERGRLMRRTIMRYICLSYTLTLAAISPPVKKRFPTLDHVTEAGIMLPNEQMIFEDIKTAHSRYFVPLAWAAALVARARKEGRIKDDFAVKTLIDEINRFRGCLGMLFNYDWMSVPLVYTQVVTLSVYTFFLSCLMGRQFIQPKDSPANRSSTNGDFYVPVFTLLQFLFYMGWLKVGETLVNPFGEDDDDFEINWVIDRNLQVSYLVVDEMHSDFPELIRDAYWDDVEFQLPYTVATESARVTSHMGSADGISVGDKQAEFVPLEVIMEDDNYYYDKDNGMAVSGGKATAISKCIQIKRLTSGADVIASSPRLLRNSGKTTSKMSSHAPSHKTSVLDSISKTSYIRSATSFSEDSNLPSPSLAAPEDDMFMMEDVASCFEDENELTVIRRPQADDRRVTMWRGTSLCGSRSNQEHRRAEITSQSTLPADSVSEGGLSTDVYTRSSSFRGSPPRGVMEPRLEETFTVPARPSIMQAEFYRPIPPLATIEPPLEVCQLTGEYKRGIRGSRDSPESTHSSSNFLHNSDQSDGSDQSATSDQIGHSGTMTRPVRVTEYTKVSDSSLSDDSSTLISDGRASSQSNVRPSLQSDVTSSQCDVTAPDGGISADDMTRDRVNTTELHSDTNVVV